MKQTLIIALLLLLLCAVTFVFIHLLLSPVPGSEPALPAQNYEASSSNSTATATASSSTAPVVTNEATATIDKQGNATNGPFAVMDAKGNDSGAIVNVLRSPEEVLIQFKDFSEKYPDGSRLYLATDLQASKSIDLGPARLNFGVFLYDIPLDTDTNTYKYIGIFSTSSEAFSYYAKIQ